MKEKKCGLKDKVKIVLWVFHGNTLRLKKTSSGICSHGQFQRKSNRDKKLFNYVYRPLDLNFLSSNDLFTNETCQHLHDETRVAPLGTICC